MSVSLRLVYRRTEPAIWLAHLDMMRTFERSIRRAGLPVAYSSGYNPRPQMVFALPVGVGIACEGELVDVLLDDALLAGFVPGQKGDPAPPEDATSVFSALSPTGQSREDLAEAWRDRLNQSLPQGLAIVAANWEDRGGPSLMSRVRAADYRLKTPGLAAAAARLLDLPAGQPWLVDKVSKGKQAEMDVRPLMIRLDVAAPDSFTVCVRAGSRENLRPDLLLQALVRYGSLDSLAADDCEVTRERLWLDQCP